MSPTTLKYFCSCTVGGLLTDCIISRFVHYRRKLRIVLDVAHSNIQTGIPTINCMWTSRCPGNAVNKVKGPFSKHWLISPSYKAENAIVWTCVRSNSETVSFLLLENSSTIFQQACVLSQSATYLFAVYGHLHRELEYCNDNRLYFVFINVPICSTCCTCV